MRDQDALAVKSAGKTKRRLVPAAFPSRPFARVSGSLDTFIAKLDMPHLPDEAAPGAEVELSGWILDPNHRAVDAAWIDIAGFTVPIKLNKARPDVARGMSMIDRLGRGTGFEDVITVPWDVSPGLHEIRVIASTRSGRGVYAKSSKRIRVAYAREAMPLELNVAERRSFTLRITDTQRAPYTLGRGAHTIRQEASLRISGTAPDVEAVSVVALPMVGDAVSWRFPNGANGNFDAMLWTGGLERGLYELIVGAVALDSASRAAPFARCFIDIAGPHYIPPLHLNALRTPPQGEIAVFVDAGITSEGKFSSTFTAGRPIGIAGWCLDPAAKSPPLAVYVEIDGKRPIPLSHHLPHRTSVKEAEEQRSGFGGIIDTTRLEPGRHTVRVLSLAAGGAGWYILDQRSIELLGTADM